MLKKLSSKGIRFYQKYLSIHLGDRCIFYPTCSEYTLQSIEKYGFLKGWIKGLNRIRRCHPFSTPRVDHI